MDVQHKPENHRFIARLDGAQGEVEYELRNGEMVITHTRVPSEIEGRGVASALTKAAFEHAREAGLTVRPVCSYAAGWAQRHPEYEARM